MHKITNTQTLNSIQLLRAIAALSVVYLHCTNRGDYKFPITGAFGVDIFFIISGFVIAYIVSQNTDHFLLKRIIRICPLYILATGMAVITMLLFQNFIHNSIPLSFSTIIKSLLFIPFEENHGQPILGQGWTLNFEAFFILLCLFAS